MNLYNISLYFVYIEAMANDDDTLKVHSNLNVLIKKLLKSCLILFPLHVFFYIIGRFEL